MVTTPGRRSSAALVAPAFGPTRLSPPPDLTDEKARRFFVDLVAASKSEHFQPVDSPLLALFCRMLAQAERATEAIAKDPATASPALLQAQAQAVKGVHDLSMRLRCSPQARSSHVNPRTKRAAPLSYYDTQRTRRRRMTRKDKDALRRALVAARALDAQTAQAVETNLKTSTWQEAAEYAAYHCQMKVLRLRPWRRRR